MSEEKTTPRTNILSFHNSEQKSETREKLSLEIFQIQSLVLEIMILTPLHMYQYTPPIKQVERTLLNCQFYAAKVPTKEQCYMLVGLEKTNS